MNPYAIPPLVTGIILAAIGLFVFFNNRSSKVVIIFFLFCLSMVWWLFGYTLMYSNTNSTLALAWARIGFLGIIFIPIFAFHFIITFLNIIVGRTFLLILYLLSVPSIILSRTNYIYSGIITHFWGFYPTAGKYYIIFLMMFAVLFSSGVWLLFKNLNRSDFTTLKKHQIRYVLLAFGLGTLGLVDYLVKYPFINIYPFGYICALLFISLIAYAIVRHQLMDIELIIKRTLVFAGMFSFVLGVVIAMAMLVSQLFGGGTFLSLAISAIIITLTIRPIELLLINVTNKYLFQKKFDYKHIISTFSDEVMSMLDLDNIVKSTLDVLNKTLYPRAASIVIYNKARDTYEAYSSVGLKDERMSFESDNALVNYLRKENGALIRHIDSHQLNAEIHSELSRLEAEVCLPFVLHNDLIGFMALGKKKSDEEYSQDDMDVLKVLARTETISIANAQLLTEAAQAELSAALGTLIAGINHEIGNFARHCDPRLLSGRSNLNGRVNLTAAIL